MKPILWRVSTWRLRATAGFLGALALGACSPALDWREVRPEGSGILAMFPCKPQLNVRPATPAEPSAMGLAECKAADLSFSLAWAELPEPKMVAPALLQMRLSMAAKLGATDSKLQALQVPGMTPNPEAQMQVLTGREQDVRIAVFSRGLRVYQLVLLGRKGGPEAWDSFLGSIKLDE